jgi:membrane-anchored protein YejM (alkaline phosphatase superfamily)
MQQRSFFLIAYIAVLVAQLPLLERTAIGLSFNSTLFALAIFICYGFIYLLPAIITTRLVQLLAKPFTPSNLPVIISAVLSSSLTVILLYADAFIYTLYGFHINGFIVNLVTTPGGIESLGGSTSAELTFTLRVIGVVSFFALVAYLLTRSQRFADGIKRLHHGYLRWALASLLALTLVERVAYAYSDATAYAPVLSSAAAFPGYQPMLCRDCASGLGIEVVRQGSINSSHESLSLNYPLEPLIVEPPNQPYNIVWLVAESWRWDMLDPQITPNAWAFSQRASRFEQHHSGGNGTRMGMFSMFYGLHGPYWFSMLDDSRAPVIMDAIRHQDYQWKMFTSAKFSYPEFDKTLFVDVEDDNLHDDNIGPSWQDDRSNIEQLLNFIERRDPDRPFMTFMFFESTHAHYYFPEENIIRSDYMKDFNYATMDVHNPQHMLGIKNRYINSANHLDSQFARVLDYLEENALLDNTIVVMTGDHGEEFMEKGRWGHNSEFTNEQIRVPLILWVPGQESAAFQHATSHIDIVPTLAPLLGIKNQTSSFSLGKSLYDEQARDFLIASDWTSIAVIDSEYKARIPTAGSRLGRNQITTRDDTEVDDNKVYFETRQQQLLEVMEQLARFRVKG